MKHLPKHDRPRWRYLAVELEADPDVALRRGPFQGALWYAAGNLLGDPGSADADLTVVRFESERGRAEAIVRVRHGETDRARAALACVTDVDGIRVGLRVRAKSGTIRACEEKYLGRRPEGPEERTVVFDGERRPAVVRSETADVRVDDSVVGATPRDLK